MLNIIQLFADRVTYPVLGLEQGRYRALPAGNDHPPESDQDQTPCGFRRYYVRGDYPDGVFV